MRRDMRRDDAYLQIFHTPLTLLACLSIAATVL